MQQLTRAFLTDSRKTALRMLQCPFGDQRFKTVSSLELCLGNRDCKKVQRFTQKKSLVKVWNHCTVFVPQTLFTLKTPAVKVGGWVTHLPSLSLTQAYTPLSCISASHLQPPTRKSKTTAWPWELKVQHRPLSSSIIMVSSGTIWVHTEASGPLSILDAEGKDAKVSGCGGLYVHEPRVHKERAHTTEPRS